MCQRVTGTSLGRRSDCPLLRSMARSLVSNPCRQGVGTVPYGQGVDCVHIKKRRAIIPKMRPLDERRLPVKLLAGSTFIISSFRT